MRTSAPLPSAARDGAGLAARFAPLAARLRTPLWPAGALARHGTPAAQSSGWPALDAELPGGGWPAEGLVELLTEAPGGELDVLAPWLQARLGAPAEAPGLIAWIAPPGQPCLAALAALGLPPARLLWLTPDRVADAAWAAEQALHGGLCSAVLWWTDARVPAPTLRRLHLAARADHAPLLALRPPGVRTQSSPAPLRLSLQPGPGRRLSVDVFKRQGPPMGEPLSLTLPWPASVRPGARLAPPLRHAVDRPAPALAAAASPALVAPRA